MASLPEKRRYPRIPVGLEIHFIRIDEKGFVVPKTGTTRDISQGGIFIESIVPFEVGSFVAVEVRLDEQELVSFVGVVRWCRELESNGNVWKTSGIGVEIVRVAAGDKARLDRFLEQQLNGVGRT